ncbi:MAG: hypothetical protein ACMUIE_05400 [Thermoplasmatota archaeon]
MLLKRSVYVLLAAAITINVGAGIWYNGIPGVLESGRNLFSDSFGGEASMEIAPSAAGDIYITSYNMSLRIDGEGQDGGGESASYDQSGTVTRSLDEGVRLLELSGTFDAVYTADDETKLQLHGDIERSRTIFRDLAMGNWLERRETTLSSSATIGGPVQSSHIIVDLKAPRAYWGDVLWETLRQECKALNSSSSGSFLLGLDLEELGVSSQRAAFDWEVISYLEIDGMARVELSIVSQLDKGFMLECLISLTENVPHPGSITLHLSGNLESEDGMLDADLRISESLLDHYNGGGQKLRWWDPELMAGELSPDLGRESFLPDEGSGDTCFWSSPRDAYDHAMDVDGRSLRGSGDMTLSRISYHRNDSRGAPTRTWNITLSSPGSSTGLYFEVDVSPEVGPLGTSVMELTKVGNCPTMAPGRERPDLITLEQLETTLRSSPYADRMFVGKEHSSTYALELIIRGSAGAGALSSLMHSAMGVERLSGRELFVSHVQDRSDPMTYYIVVVDGSTGEIISSTEASGLCTVLFRTYGIDLS